LRSSSSPIRCEETFGGTEAAAEVVADVNNGQDILLDNNDPLPACEFRINKFCAPVCSFPFLLTVCDAWVLGLASYFPVTIFPDKPITNANNPSTSYPHGETTLLKEGVVASVEEVSKDVEGEFPSAASLNIRPEPCLTGSGTASERTGTGSSGVKDGGNPTNSSGEQNIGLSS